MPRFIFLFFTMAFFHFEIQSQTFFLDANGVTIKCIDCENGDQGTVNGITYTALDRDSLSAQITEMNNAQDFTLYDLSLVCTSLITNMESLLSGLSGNQNIGAWDVSNVNDMSSMFGSYWEFNQDLQYWDVSNVTDMSNMFQWCDSFNGNITTWDTGQVVNMKGMFIGCFNFNQDLDQWNVGSVTDMSEMFFGCDIFNQSLSGWDVGHVTTMEKMFNYSLQFDQDLSGWDVSAVTNMSNMFHFASAFNKPLETWDVSSVTDMSGMFYSASNFNQPLNNWSISSVESTSEMFYGAVAFDQDISNWDVSGVRNFKRMFAYAFAFNQDLSAWDTSSMVELAGIFRNATSFNSNISTWDVSQVQEFDLAFTYAAQFNQSLSSWDMSSATSLDAMFCFATNFNQELSSWDVSGVQNFRQLFRDATSFNQDISNWNVSSATNMYESFFNASSFSGDISNWCVQGIPSEPFNFSIGSMIGANQSPNWGACPGLVVCNDPSACNYNPDGNSNADCIYNDPGTSLKSHLLGNGGQDIARNLIQTADNSIVAIGETNSWGAGAFDQYLVGIQDPLDSTELIWGNPITRGGPGMEQGYAVLELPNGSFITGGYSESGAGPNKTASNYGGADFWIVFWDSNGSPTSDYSYGGAGQDLLLDMELVEDGILLAGISNSDVNQSGGKYATSNGNYDYWVVKIDFDGNHMWDRSFGGTDYDDLKSISSTSDGAFILCGQSNSNRTGDKSEDSRGDYDMWLVKMNQDGYMIWDKTIGGDQFDSANETIELDGEIYIGGISFSGLAGDKDQAGIGGMDFWIVKTDLDGNLLQQKTLGGSGQDQCFGILDFQGNLVAFGDSNSPQNEPFGKTSPNLGGLDFWLVALDQDLSNTPLWDVSLGGGGDERLLDAIVLNSGRILLGGYSGGAGDGNYYNVSSNDPAINLQVPSGIDLWLKPFVPEGETGCTDETACNYNVSATCDDGSCVFVVNPCDSCSGEVDGTGTVVANDTDADGSCDEQDCAPNDSDVFPGAPCDDNNPESINDIILADCTCAGTIPMGCTDPCACNYDDQAIEDDGSCLVASIFGVPNSFELSCDEIVPDPPVVTVQYCNLELQFEENVITSDCEGFFDVVRNYSIILPCGQELTESYTIEVRDNFAPVLDITGFTETVNVHLQGECEWVFQEPEELLVTDNCDSDPTYSVFPPFGTAITETTTITYTTEDCTLNTSIQEQTIVISYSELDIDQDGLGEYEELCLTNTDPNNPDSDGDGIEDGIEVNVTLTDPNVFDTDDNGFSDLEDLLGTAGCTYPSALNYNAMANLDDGSCDFSCQGDYNLDGMVTAADLLSFLSEFGGACNP